MYLVSAYLYVLNKFFLEASIYLPVSIYLVGIYG